MASSASSILLLSLLFWGVVFGYPVLRILKRLGFSGFWAILAFVPIANLIALWVLAFTNWPVETANGARKLEKS